VKACAASHSNVEAARRSRRVLGTNGNGKSTLMKWRRRPGSGHTWKHFADDAEWRTI